MTLVFIFNYIVYNFSLLLDGMIGGAWHFFKYLWYVDSLIIETKAPMSTSMVMSAPLMFMVTWMGFTRLLSVLNNLYIYSLGKWSASESVIWIGHFWIFCLVLPTCTLHTFVSVLLNRTLLSLTSPCNVCALFSYRTNRRLWIGKQLRNGLLDTNSICCKQNDLSWY